MDTFNHELINTINSFVFDTPLMFAVGNIRNIIKFAINLSDVKKSEK